MTIYRTFDEALEAWRELGGVLSYYCSCSIGPECWELILDEETVKDYIGTECVTPREMTEYALAMGGLTPEEIEREMADWQD